MLKTKYFTYFSFIILMAMVISIAPQKVMAQDDLPDEEESIMPPLSTPSNPTPPIIDDSDSGSVSDIEEYDG
ncbi:MAG: hypothetical protein KBD76_14345 [Bacteriovorax sp.]|nr:hypothetical protein [Bacteriovorax sp.]